MGKSEIQPGTEPSAELYARVRAGFVRQGVSLTKWCLARAIHPNNARSALTGRWTGPKARMLVEAATKAAEIDAR